MHLTVCSRGRKASVILTQEHINYVLADTTMELWVGLSLKERCRWFKNRFPHAGITPSSLGRLYKQHGIKKKVICRNKRMPGPEQHKMMEQRADVLARLEHANNMDLEIVYVDECCFTKKDIMKREWSNRGQHMNIMY
jgi:hypothetical protein